MKTLNTLIILFVTSTAVAVPPPKDIDLDRILDAIQKVETGGCKDPSLAVGDNGKAIGSLQIHYPYWKDATDFDPSIGGKYSDCTDEAYARKIAIAYFTRYSPNWEIETLAGIHNGGTKGHLRKATVNYRAKVAKIYAADAR